MDGGDPPRRSVGGRVVVKVIRNLNAPVFVFDEGEAEVTVDETLGTGNEVYGIEATDEDEVCCIGCDWIQNSWCVFFLHQNSFNLILSWTCIQEFKTIFVILMCCFFQLSFFLSYILRVNISSVQLKSQKRMIRNNWNLFEGRGITLCIMLCSAVLCFYFKMNRIKWLFMTGILHWWYYIISGTIQWNNLHYDRRWWWTNLLHCK